MQARVAEYVNESCRNTSPVKLCRASSIFEALIKGFEAVGKRHGQDYAEFFVLLPRRIIVVTNKDSSAKRYGRHFFLAKVGESCQNMPQIPAHCP